MLSLCALSVAFSPGLQQCPRVASAAPAAVAIRAPHPVAALDPQQLSAIVGAVALGGGAVYYNSQKSKSPSPPPAPKAAAPPKPAPKKAAPKKDTWGIKNRKGFRGGVNKPKPKTPKRKLWKPPAGWEVRLRSFYFYYTRFAHTFSCIFASSAVQPVTKIVQSEEEREALPPRRCRPRRRQRPSRSRSRRRRCPSTRTSSQRWLTARPPSKACLTATA